MLVELFVAQYLSWVGGFACFSFAAGNVDPRSDRHDSHVFRDDPHDSADRQRLIERTAAVALVERTARSCERTAPFCERTAAFALVERTALVERAALVERRRRRSPRVPVIVAVDFHWGREGQALLRMSCIVSC